jgi:2-polyprenyl-6-methoxyphenol hydroxylase-like FAD-dependent oxidoreductase
MTARVSCDVLVIGARCAGASTAMLLARAGLRVLLIDRGDYGSDTISTHALMRAGVLQLRRWGLLRRIERAGTPPVRSTAFHYGDEVVEVAISRSHGVEALYAPRRTVLDRLLVDAAWDAGAEIRFRHSLAQVIGGPGGRVCGAVLRDGAGEAVEVKAEVVVGADGLGSALARLVGAPILHQGLSASAVIYGHWSGLGAQGYHWYFRPNASAGVIPTNGNLHCVFAAMPAARYRAGLRGEAGYRRILAETVPEIAEALAAITPEEPISTFAGRAGFLRQAWGPGWALVGDAGYFKDPLTAHGMTDALRDAELVARAVLEGTESALARFATMRDELSMPFLEATDAIASFDWNLETVRRHHETLHRVTKREVEHLAALPPMPPEDRIPARSSGERAEIEKVIP